MSRGKIERERIAAERSETTLVYMYVLAVNGSTMSASLEALKFFILSELTECRVVSR